MGPGRDPGWWREQGSPASAPGVHYRPPTSPATPGAPAPGADACPAGLEHALTLPPSWLVLQASSVEPILEFDVLQVWVWAWGGLQAALGGSADHRHLLGSRVGRGRQGGVRERVARSAWGAGAAVAAAVPGFPRFTWKGRRA